MKAQSVRGKESVMRLLSQGSKIEVLRPEMKRKAEEILKLYS